MHKNLEELPMADPGREEDARWLFPYKDMTAEEYAAREGHKWLCFSFGEYRYSDGDLNQWIHTLDDIFFTPGETERIRQEILSADELERIQEGNDHSDESAA